MRCLGSDPRASFIAVAPASAKRAYRYGRAIIRLASGYYYFLMYKKLHSTPPVHKKRTAGEDGENRRSLQRFVQHLRARLKAGESRGQEGERHAVVGFSPRVMHHRGGN